MPSTTYAEFGHDTEGLEVAKAFADGIRGKTILVTGANSGGIAYTTLEAFVSLNPSLPTPTPRTEVPTLTQASQIPSHLILASRTPSKIHQTIQKLKLSYPAVSYRALTLDLSSQKSVRDAAAELLAWEDIHGIDLIINNAGVMGLSNRDLTPEGIEMHFGTNHIGHFLFTSLLMPRLLVAARRNPRGATRVINITSGSPAVAGIRWSDINFERKSKDLPEEERPNPQISAMWGFPDVDERSYIPIEGYNQSKVANVLFSIGLTARLFQKYGILSLAVHPGVIPTELVRDFGAELQGALTRLRENSITYKTLGAGASTSLTAALDPKLVEGAGVEKDGRAVGVFLKDCQVEELSNAKAVSMSGAEKLWELSEKLVGEKFAW